MSIRICTTCGRQVNKDTTYCVCGGFEFMEGNIRIEEFRVVCFCGNGDLNLIDTSRDGKDTQDIFECDVCGNKIIKERFING
jgi:predicted RNA-binding Zn-ribbon protein involved in translation (DUF1610 family)